jgi:hypothetical protein
MADTTNQYDQYNPDRASATPAYVPPDATARVNQYDQYNSDKPAYAARQSLLNPDAPSKPGDAPKQYGLGEALWGGLKAIPNSVFKFAKDVFHTGTDFVDHPIDTTGKAARILATLPPQMAALIGGTGLNMADSVLNQLTPEGHEALLNMGNLTLHQMSPDMQAAIREGGPEMTMRMVGVANAVGEQKKKEYISNPGEPTGSALLRTIHDDPLTIPLDLSTGLAGGAGLAGLAAKAAGPLTAMGVEAAGVGAGLGKAAAVTNPINWGLKGAKALANATGATAVGGRVADAVLPSLVGGRYFNGISNAAQNHLVDRATEGDVAGVRNSMNNAFGASANPTQIVPGSMPTAGNMASQMGDNAPRSFAAMQADANHNLGTIADVRNIQNNQTRLNHLDPIGRDPVENTRAFGSPLTHPDDMEAGIKASDAVNYNRSGRHIATANPELLDIINDPISARAVRNASTTADIENQDFWIGHNKPAQPATTRPSGMLDASGRPIMVNVPAQPAEYAQMTGENFQKLKEEYDALLYGPGSAAEPPLVGSQRTALMAKRTRLINWGNANIPGWQHARETHAIQNNILDRLNMGDQLSQKLGNALAGPDSANLNANAYANALKEAPAKTNSIISKSTDKPRGDTLDSYFNPQEMDRTNAVHQDLGRDKLTAQQAVAGNDFRGSLNTAGGDFMGGDALGGIPGVKPVLNFLTSGANKIVSDRISHAMFDPLQMEQILSQALNRKQELQMAGRGVNYLYDKTLGAVNKYPSLYPAMQDDREQRMKDATAKKRNALNK